MNCRTLEFSVIRHSDVDEKRLRDICRLKNECWPYGQDEQLNWINKHLRNNDEHIIGDLEGNAVCYLNLVAVSIATRSGAESALGIGNVCAMPRSMGYGRAIVEFANTVLDSRQMKGLLFCDPSASTFYEKCGWVQFDIQKAKLSFDINTSVRAMSYNLVASEVILSVDGPYF